jgi:hypothetical protein
MTSDWRLVSVIIWLLLRIKITIQIMVLEHTLLPYQVVKDEEGEAWSLY